MEGVALSLDQSKKRERALEEEGKTLAEERADAVRLLKEIQGDGSRWCDAIALWVWTEMNFLPPGGY